MKWIKGKVMRGEVASGVWLMLGSQVAAEIAGNAGFDWCLLDLEHGLGGHSSLLQQIQALAGTNATPVVRITNNDPSLIKLALDIGAGGIMVPCVNNAREAELVVKFMRYPPEGVRGMDPGSRASLYGANFKDYYAKANRELLTVIQIESAEGVNNAEEIAALEGVDVLFIGHVDLSLSLGCFPEIEHPDVVAAEEKVLAACAKHGKKAGLLLKRDDIARATKKGFTFIAHGTDIGMLCESMRECADCFQKSR